MPAIRQLFAALILTASASIASAQPRRPNATPPQDPLRFQFLGPVSGGRISAISGVVGDPRTWYLGAASGGVWKSSDSGSTYAPVFDAQPVQAIGALAVSASNPSVVWAGTGEAWAIRDADVMGDGIYRSTDAGATWTNVGLRETGRIGRIILHPTNPDIAFVCALGRATGPQQERGVYRTTDGGRNWQRVLFVNENTGCSGLAIDANDPNVLFAGTWEVVMHTWVMNSGGAGSGVYVSRDGGTAWTRLETGLPKSPLGKIDVAVAPSNSKRVYALIQTANQGSLWRSDDGGTAWNVVSWDRTLIGRAGYYIRIEVNPKNENEVLIANSSFHRSTDGGKTFPITGGGCGDCHDIWMDPRNPDHWGVTGDGGAGITWNHGRTFSNITLPIGQMYHVAVDEQVPYWVYSNRQDNGTMRGPSTAPEAGQNSVRRQGGLGGRGGPGGGRDTTGRAADSTGGPPQQPVTSPGDSAARRATPTSDTTVTAGEGGGGGFGGGGGSTWDHGLGGCESGFTIPDPSDPNIVWSSCYGNHVTRWDARTKRARSVPPWIHTLDSPPNELKYRCHWTPPLAIDPFDPKTVYYGCQVVFKTSNGGQSWVVTSPDLSTRDSSRIAFSGGIVGDNLGQFYGEVVFAIAPSPIRRGLVWAGTNDGQLWYTRDGGGTWTNVSRNMTGLPAWGTIRQIAPSSFDPAVAYVAVDFHMMDNREPFLYKTTDFGRTWTRITGDLPTGHPLAYVMSVAENPNKRGMIFAGTGNAFYYSRDDGAHWTRVKEGLPAAPVTWIVAPKARWHDVVVSTYGRGIYLLRDITALELGAATVVADANEGGTGPTPSTPARATDGAVRLYSPPAGYREARSGRTDITFSIPAATRDSAKLEIMDSTGAVIRTLKATTRAGLNRVTWDLRYDPPTRVELRTTPPDNPHIWEEPRFRTRQTRPISHWGIDGPMGTGPLALPGRYSVRLTASGTTTPPERFTVTRATETTVPMADLVASTRAQLRIRDAMNASAAMINRIEVMRRQLEDQRKKSSADADVVSAVDAMDKKLLDVELRLLSRTDLHSDDKWYVESYKIYMNLIWLAGEVGTGAGDVAGGAEFRPTDASLATLAMLEKDLAAAKVAYDRVMRDDVAAFNKSMSGKLPSLVF